MSSKSNRKTVSAALVILFGLALLATAAAAATPAPKSVLDRFTPEQRKKLEAGEAIYEFVKTAGAGGQIQGHGQSMVIINTPLEEAFQLFLKFDRQYQYFPRKTVSRVISVSPTAAVIYNEFDFYVTTIKYTVDYVINRAGHRIDFKLDPKYPHDIADSAGFFLFEKIDDKRTLFTYAATKVETGLKVPGFIQEYLTSRDLPAMAANVKKWIESRGTWVKPD